MLGNPESSIWTTVIYNNRLDIEDIVNPQPRLLLQHRTEDIVGMNIEGLEAATVDVNRQQCRVIASRVKKAQQQKRNIYFEYVSIQPDNSVAYAVCHLEFAADGRIYQYLVEVDAEDVCDGRKETVSSAAHVTHTRAQCLNDVCLSRRYQELYSQNHSILVNLPVGVELYSKEGILEYMNERDCEIFGVDRKEILSAGLSLFDNPNLPQEIKEAVRLGRSVKADFPYSFAKVEENGYYRISQRKNVKRIECQGLPVLNSEGGFDSYVFIVGDITDYYNQTQALEEARRNLTNAMDAGGVTAWELDLATNVFSGLHGDLDTKEYLNNSLEETLKWIHPDDYTPYMNVIRSISSGEIESVQMIVRFVDRVGTCIYYDNRMGGRKNSQGIVTHITGIQRDITKESIQKQEIENARKSLDLAMSAADITAWSYDLLTRKRKVLYSNFTEDISDDYIRAMVHPDDQDTFLRHFYSVASGERVKDSILVRISKDGEYHYFESTILLVTNEDKQGSYVVGALKDVTDFLSIETELKQQRDFVSLALDAGNLSIWIYDVGTRIFSSLEGHTLSDQGLSMEEYLALVHPDDRGAIEEQLRGIIAGTSSKLDLHFRYMNPDDHNNCRYFESSMQPIYDEAGHVTRLTGTQKEVTEVYLQQAELWESKCKADLAIRTAGSMLWEFDCHSGLFTSYNEPLNQFDETKRITPEAYIDQVHSEDREVVYSHIEQMKRGVDESFSFGMRMKYFPEDTEWQYCVVSGSPFNKASNGLVTKYVGIRKNDTNIHNKMELLRTALNNIPLPVYIKDEDYRIIFYNEECGKLYGGIESDGSYDFLDRKQIEKMNSIDSQVFSTGIPYLGQEKITLLNGRECETFIRKSIVYGWDKRLLLCVRWDESEQQELLRKSKILSVSMSALDAYTWYFDSRNGLMTYGDGFCATGGDAEALNTFDKYIQRIHPEERGNFDRLINEHLEAGSGDFTIEYRIDLADNGKYEWWECRGVVETTVLNDQTSYVFMYGMDINIDKHKRNELMLLVNRRELSNLNRQNELILNNTNSGLAYISTDFIVQWENISTCWSEFPPGIYKKGELCYHSTHGRTTPCEECVMRRAMESRKMETMAFDFKQSAKSVEVFATPVLNDNGEVEGMVIRIDDVTERKKMISDLQQAKIHAEQSDKLKSAFLANMSHEIRTPLNAIVGFSDLILTTEDEEERAEYGKIIATNNELLLKLINDILDLSKIESGSVDVQYEKFDLSEYFDEIAVSMQCRMTNPDIKFICTNPYPSCVVVLDKKMVMQILTNYVTNAIKYTADGHIEMGYEHTGDQLRLYVSDSGIGISEDKKYKVFHRFEKLDEFAQGTGLGLSICKALADALGGTVGFDTKEGVGSIFWAIIPCKADFPDARGGGIFVEN